MCIEQAVRDYRMLGLDAAQARLAAHVDRWREEPMPAIDIRIGGDRRAGRGGGRSGPVIAAAPPAR